MDNVNIIENTRQAKNEYGYMWKVLITFRYLLMCPPMNG